MRSRSILRALLLAALVTVSGCGTKTSPLLPAPDGIRATWAGTSFQGEAVVYQYGSELEFVGHTDDGQQQSRGVRITISNYTGPGSYSLDAGDATVLHVIGLDQIVARYGTSAAGAGTLVVSGMAEGRIFGTVEFEADLLPSAAQPAGTRARFEGEFDAIIQAPGV